MMAYPLGLPMSLSSLLRLCPPVLCPPVLLGPQILAQEAPDAQAWSRALETREGRGKGNQDARKPKAWGLSSTGLQFQEAHVVPIRMTS